jgi:L-seryl-tRNA(Ser) seleniumtransferase
VDARRAIPSIERLLSSPELQPLLERESRARVTEMLRALQRDLRVQDSSVSDAGWYASQLEQRITRVDRRSLREVINATGVILHTNLGRAPLSDAAIAAIAGVAQGYNNLEYDIDEGKRGSRYTHCESLLRSLTGANAALVVNNNAAALVLVLNTVAMGKRVAVSRGELIEIGDSFRIADIAERSGILLREVGATNRTHVRDYEQAADDAGAILKVHPSNFKTSGFVSEVSASELSGVARSAGIPLVHDLGSGLIESLEDLGLAGEPTASQALAAGADILTMSGDKLLGGPQAGIILGNADLIDSMKRNPLCRALRVDKLTLAALEATLSSYVRGTARTEIPILRMISASRDELKTRATAFAARFQNASVVEGNSAIGGGAYPEAILPTWLVALEGNAGDVEAKLRNGTPAVIARIAQDRVLIDLRTVLPQQETVLAERIADAI